MIRKLRTTIFASCMLLCTSFSAMATTVYTVTLNQSARSTDTATPSYSGSVPTKGHRTPPIAIVCTISDTDGLYISTLDNDEILMFGIYDENGNCIASYYNEADFISALFTLSGTYEVQFTTEDYTYVGYISL